MTLLHPWWLAAYPAVLALWWLAPRAAVDRPVAALFLWHQIAPERSRRADLAWRPAGVRVPVILLCLLVALAGPRVGKISPSPREGAMGRAEPPVLRVAEVPSAPLPPGGAGGRAPGPSSAPGATTDQLATSSAPTPTLPRRGRELIGGVTCDGPAPEFLQHFLEDLGATCQHGSPWHLRVEPGTDTTARPLLWDLGDPLLAGAPGTIARVRGARALPASPRDRVLARAGGRPAIVLHSTAMGEELVIGADLAEPGLRDDPTLPLLLANWVASATRPSPGTIPPTTPEVESPGLWRWAVAAALAVLWLPPPRHRRWHLAATVPLVAALMVTPSSCGRGGGQRTLLLDVSPSARRAGPDDLLAAAAEALEGATTAAVVAVGETPEVWVAQGTAVTAVQTRLRTLLAAPAPLSRRTALSDGLAVARNLSPGGDVLVVSDGRAPPPTAVHAGAPVHTVLIEAPVTRPEPTTLRVGPQRGGTTTALVQYQGPPDHSFPIAWRIGDRTYTQTAATGPDGWGEARLAMGMDGNMRRIEARLDGGPPIAALVAPAGPPVVLIAGASTPSPAAEGVALESVASDRLADRLATEPFPAAVVLDDAPATTLGPDLLEVLTRRVRNGGLGLLITGGTAGVGGGGYHRSPMEPALPLLLDQPPGRAPVAVAVVLDRSGSMVEGTVPTLELGVAAVLALRRGVDRQDRWAAWAFDMAIHALDPLGPPPAEADLRRRLATLQGSGGTDPWLAIRRAAEELAAAPETGRHLALVTDGHLPPPPPGWQGDVLAGAGITLDLVQVGRAPPSPAAVAVAAATGGTVHSIPDAAALPGAITVAAPGEGDTPFRTGRFPYRPSAAEAPFPLAGGTVDGYCPAQTAPGGVSVLQVAGGAPLLALGRHGLGRTAVWTGTAKTLLGQPDLWTGLLSWLAPPPSDRLGCLLTGATLRVTYRAPTNPPLPPGGGREEGAWTRRDAEPHPSGDGRSNLPHPSPPPQGERAEGPSCRVESADGTAHTFPLQRTGDDLWTGTAELPTGGRYRVEVAHPAGGPAVAEKFVLLEPDPEWVISPAAGKAVLARIARESGGRFLAMGQPLPPPPRAREPWHSYPPLLLLTGAILLMSPRPAPFRRRNVRS